MTTITDLAQRGELSLTRGRYNMVNSGVRTGKTFWAVNGLQKYTRDGKLNRILYLTDTGSLKSSICSEYADKCCEADDRWMNRYLMEEEINKIGIMCYQGLATQCLTGRPAFLKDIDVICWDECDTIFDFAKRELAEALRTDFRPKHDAEGYRTVSNAEILSVIQQYSTSYKYRELVLLGEWERIINEHRIMCVGISATPEAASRYYSMITNASNTGRLQSVYRMGEDIYFRSLAELLATLQPIEGKGYWCYSPYIAENKRYVELANSMGFNAIEIHSINNEDYPMTEEQMSVADSITAFGVVPPEYDFIFVNKAYQRGFNLYDPRFNRVIIDSTSKTDQDQACRMTYEFIRMVKSSTQPIPDKYMERWLTLAECRELAEELKITDPTYKKKAMTWNSLKKILPEMGYEVEETTQRENGKRAKMYYIKGQWKDIEPKDRELEQLISAKLVT